MDEILFDSVGAVGRVTLNRPKALNALTLAMTRQLDARLIDWAGGKPVTIRTLDAGGDKPIPGLTSESEPNPFLGLRGLRLSLARAEVFRVQLRALARAAARGPLKVMFPMVTVPSEMDEARALFEKAAAGLARAGAEVRVPPLGMMIEVPSAALIADTLARECDFFSVGTNDLTQYTLAVDRGNERVAHLYDPLHPAVLTLIDLSVRAARRARIPISVCGEMATNPLAVPLLVGLRIHELSGTPSQVPLVKEIVRAVDSSDVAEDARRALTASCVEEVEQIAAARLRDVGLLDHPDIGPWIRRVVEPILGRA